MFGVISEDRSLTDLSEDRFTMDLSEDRFMMDLSEDMSLTDLLADRSMTDLSNGELCGKIHFCNHVTTVHCSPSSKLYQPLFASGMKSLT